MIQKLRLLVASLLLVGSIGFATVGTASAFDLFADPCSANPDATVCKESSKAQTQNNNSLWGPDGIIGKIVSLLSFIIGVAAVIVIIIAGIQYMLSTGDATKVNNAKNAILYAVIGLIVALLAQVIVRFVIVRVA